VVSQEMARAMRTVSLAKRLILFLAKMKFAGKSHILRFIYQKLEIWSFRGKEELEIKSFEVQPCSPIHM
jgi:hypothetical protein